MRRPPRPVKDQHHRYCLVCSVRNIRRRLLNPVAYIKTLRKGTRMETISHERDNMSKSTEQVVAEAKTFVEIINFLNGHRAAHHNPYPSPCPLCAQADTIDPNTTDILTALVALASELAIWKDMVNGWGDEVTSSNEVAIHELHDDLLIANGAQPKYRSTNKDDGGCQCGCQSVRSASRA